MAESIADVNRYIPPGMTVPPVPTGAFSFPTSTIPVTQGALPTTTIQSGIPGVSPFTFNFAEAQTNAYNNLKAFYDKLLEFAGGKLDLAKRILQYTYEQGMRESAQTYEQESKNLALAFPTETSQLQTTQNRRGVMQSGFGGTERQNLQESQNLRQLVVQRALENRNANLGANLGFGKEQEERTFGESQFDLERKRREEAGQMTNQLYGVKSAEFQGQVNKAAQDEQRRIQEEQNKSLTNIYNTTSTGGGYTGGGNTDQAFRSYMAEHGKQTELDVATHGATQQGSEYYALKKRYGF